MRTLLSTLLLFLLADLLCAAPPTITNFQPRGAQPGKPVTLVLTGTNLDPDSRLTLPFKASQKPILDPKAKPNPTQLRLELTVDSSVTPSVYPIRVVNAGGVSTLSLFRIDNFPIGAEVEDNTSFEKAQKITWPIAVEGTCAGGDVDYFRFTARKGQRIVIEVEAARLGSGVLPQLRITDERKRFLGSDDSQSLQGDARVILTAPADGDIVVELSDSRYRGGNPAFYRLRIAEYDVAEEVFPLGGKRGETVGFALRGGSLSGDVKFSRKMEPSAGRVDRMVLQPEGIRAGMLPFTVAVSDLPEVLRQEGSGALNVAPPVVVNGRVDKPGQKHRVRFPVKAGEKWRFAVEAEVLGSRLDGVLRILDEKEKQLAQFDDTDIPSPAPGQPGSRTLDPSGEFTVPAGVTTLLVELADQRERGGINYGYRLRIEPIEDDFSLSIPVTEFNVSRGSAVGVSVPVIRRGYTGPITLHVSGAPAGYRVQGGRIPAGAVTGVLTITAEESAPTDPLTIRIEGEGRVGEKKFRRQALMKVFAAREAGASGLYTFDQLLLARTSPAPITLKGPAEIALIKGYPTEIPVTITRSKGQEKLALPLTVLVPGPNAGPTGFAVKPTTSSAGDQAKLTITAGVNASDGSTDLAVTTTFRVGPQQYVVSTSAIPTVIRPPFVIELPDRLTLKPGEKVKLTGKIRRESVCKEVVRLNLATLPAGVTLVKPVTVAAGASEFVLELQANPKATPAKTMATLTASATVGGMNYVAPTKTVEIAVGK